MQEEHCPKQRRTFSCQIFNGYHPLLAKTRENSKNGGVGLFIKNDIQYEERPELSIFIPHVTETLFIELQLGINNIIVGVVYRPNTPPLANFDNFLTSFSDSLNRINTSHKQCVIMRDFNIDLLKYSSHSKTTDFVNGIVEQGTIPVITKPTCN